MCSPNKRFVSGTKPFKAQITILSEILTLIFLISALTYSDGTAMMITSELQTISFIFSEIFNFFSFSSTELK